MSKSFMPISIGGGHFKFDGNEPQRKEPIQCEYEECQELVWQCSSVFCHKHQIIRRKEYLKQYRGGNKQQYEHRIKNLKSRRLLKRYKTMNLVNRYLLKNTCPCCKVNKIEKRSLCCRSCANFQHLND